MHLGNTKLSQAEGQELMEYLANPEPLTEEQKANIKALLSDDQFNIMKVNSKKNNSKTVRDLLTKGTPTGFTDKFGTPYTIGCLVAFKDIEGFSCAAELIVRDNFSIGIDAWDRTKDVNELHQSEDYIVEEERIE